MSLTDPNADTTAMPSFALYRQQECPACIGGHGAVP
jgi:hypothetical protein